MDCGACPLSLICMRGDLKPEPCDVCDRLTMSAPNPDPSYGPAFVYFVIRCPVSSPTREFVHDEEMRGICCPGCAPRLWQITRGGVVAHVLDPR